MEKIIDSYSKRTGEKWMYQKQKYSSEKESKDEPEITEDIDVDVDRSLLDKNYRCLNGLPLRCGVIWKKVQQK